MFFAMAIIFATWQPFVWWRGVGGAILLACGFYGWYLRRQNKRNDASG